MVRDKMGKNTFVTLGVFVVLLVAFLATKEDKVRVGIRELNLVQIDKEELTEIVVSGKNKAILRKAGSTWTVENPDAPGKSFPVEKASIDRALDEFKKLEAGTFVSARKEKHEDLEVNAEKGLSVKATGGNKTLDIVLGRRGKRGGNFIRVSGTDEVFEGKGNLASMLAKDVNAWRKKKLLDHKVEDVKQLILSHSGNEKYTIAKSPDAEGAENTWTVSEGPTPPEGFRLDSNKLNILIREWSNLRVSDFVDEAKSAEETGLGPNADKWTGELQNGKSITVSLGKDNDKNQTYVQLVGEPQIYLVSTYYGKRLRKGFLDHRDLSLWSVDPAKITSVQFRHPDGLAELTQKDGAWTVTKPATLPAGLEFDPSTVGSKLSALSKMQAVQFVGPEALAQKAFKKSVTITVNMDDKSTKTLQFGDAVKAEHGDPKTQVYTKAGDGYVYSIGQFNRKRYSNPLELFKKVEPPPNMGGMQPGMGGAPGGMPPGMGGIQGLENLPPDVRKKLMESIQKNGMPGGR
jgi:hypothetical protein